jgi:hypothetical protein
MVRQRVHPVGKRGLRRLRRASCRCEASASQHLSPAACHDEPVLRRLWPASSLALIAGLAPPVLAQNAASIPAVVTVIQSPFASAQSQGIYGWAPAGGAGQVPPPGHRVFLLANFVALITEGVEPAKVRVRLEYVGN